MAKPILKWAGGKRQLMDDLYARFPSSFETERNRYHEPFFGSGALFFDLEPPRATINDLNERLYNFFIQVRGRPDELIQRLRDVDDPNSKPDSELEFNDVDRKGNQIKSYYYQQRALFNRRPAGESFDPLDEAARLLYLNRTCFNGLYRVHSDGGFNVLIGRYSNPDWVRPTVIRKASAVLSRLDPDDIHNDNYDYVLEEVQEVDVVYFDPPYQPLSSTANFAEYSAGGFGQEEQRELLEVAKELNDMEAWVILSNSGVMYDFYEEAGFSVDIEGATRAINSDATNRGEVDEIIATNVPPEKRQRHGLKQISDF
jgi:DNA adenine methylase